MVTFLRRSLSLAVCALAFACVFLSSLPTAPVRAGGALPILPGGSSLRPGGETPIQLTSEVAVIDIRAATEEDNSLVELDPGSYTLRGRPAWFPAVAEVEADFTLKNPTGAAISTTAWFPLASVLENAAWSAQFAADVPRLTSFEFSVNGNPLDTTFSELPNPQGPDAPRLPWVGFPLAIPAGSETVVHASYKVPVQFQSAGEEMLLYYLFQNGAVWDGPVGRTELVLNLPYPASAETLAGISPGDLHLPPYSREYEAGGLPPGANLEGNQVRFAWQDFEPGLADTLAIKLLLPATWQELEAARAAAAAKPQDGQAWLDLAANYSRLSWGDWSNLPAIFSSSYNAQGIAAFRKAIELLPGHPAPHAGLGLLTLAAYFPQKNASADILQAVQEEYRIARALDAKNPSFIKKTAASGGILGKYEAGLMGKLERALDAYLSGTGARPTATLVFQNGATATAFAASWSCWAATGAECAPTSPPTLTFTSTPAQAAAQTLITPSSPKPEATPTVTPVRPPQSTQPTGSGQNLAALIAAGLFLLGIVVYLLWRRARKNSKEVG